VIKQQRVCWRHKILFLLKGIPFPIPVNYWEHNNIIIINWISICKNFPGCNCSRSFRHWFTSISCSAHWEIFSWSASSDIISNLGCVMSLPCTFYMICLVAININGQQTNFAGNHKNIFNDARVPWSEYRYYDPKTVGLDFEGMISDIKVCCRSVTLHSKKNSPFCVESFDGHPKLRAAVSFISFFVFLTTSICTSVLSSLSPSLPLGMGSAQACDWIIHY